MPAQNLVSRSASGKILRRKRIVLTIGEFGAAAVRLSARTIIKAESVAVFAALLGSVVILQVLAGAYASGFGGYPDEPAHLVSSLMVRDFLVGLDFRHVAVCTAILFSLPKGGDWCLAAWVLCRSRHAVSSPALSSAYVMRFS
jgi:hypothetical protein